MERDGREAKQRALLRFGADPGDHEQSERRAARAALRPKALGAKTHADGSEQRQQPDRPPRLRLNDQHERINIAENHREQQPAEARDDHRPKQTPDRGRRGCRREAQRRRVDGERRPGGLSPQQRKQKGRAQAQDDQPVPVEPLQQARKQRQAEQRRDDHAHRAKKSEINPAAIFETQIDVDGASASQRHDGMKQRREAQKKRGERTRSREQRRERRQHARLGERPRRREGLGVLQRKPAIGAARRDDANQNRPFQPPARELGGESRHGRQPQHKRGHGQQLRRKRQAKNGDQRVDDLRKDAEGRLAVEPIEVIGSDAAGIEIGQSPSHVDHRIVQQPIISAPQEPQSDQRDGADVRHKGTHV